MDYYLKCYGYSPRNYSTELTQISFSNYKGVITILGNKLHEYIIKLDERANTYSNEGKFGEADELWKVAAELRQLLK